MCLHVDPHAIAKRAVMSSAFREGSETYSVSGTGTLCEQAVANDREGCRWARGSITW